MMTIAVRQTAFSSYFTHSLLVLNYIFLCHFLRSQLSVLYHHSNWNHQLWNFPEMRSHLERCALLFFPASCQISLTAVQLQISDWCLSLAFFFFQIKSRVNLSLRFLVGEDHKSSRNDCNLKSSSPWNMQLRDVSFLTSCNQNWSMVECIPLCSDYTLSAQLQPSSACAGPVITCFYHRLVQAVRWHWEQWAHENKSPIKTKGMSESGSNLSKT